MNTEFTRQSDFPKLDFVSRFVRLAFSTFPPCLIAALLCCTSFSQRLLAQNPRQTLQSAQTSELHALLRNDELRTWQNTAYRLFKENRNEAALHQIQKIFDSTDDGFERRSNGLGFAGIRETMSQLLSTAPQDLRDLYELIHGAEARAVWRKAQQDLDLDGWREVYRRWFHTRAGFEAAHQLAAWHLDHGNPDFAATLWERILADPLHASRFTDAHRAVFMTACRQAGLVKQWDDQTRTASHDYLVLGGQRISRADWSERLTPPLLPEATDWPQPLGSSSREIRRLGSAPATSPLYSIALLDSMRDKAALVRRLEDHHRKNSAIGGGMMPVVVENQLIFRDASSVRGLSLLDGRQLWKYPLQISLQDGVSRRSNDADQQPDEIELDRLGLSNSLSGAMSADAERVYIIEGPFPDPDSIPVAGNSPNSSAGGMFRLVALPLDTRNPIENPQPVSPVWTLGDSAPEGKHPWTCLGPPVPAYGKLYCIAESDSLLSLLELDPATGKILDQTPLAVPQQPFRRDQTRIHLACIPSISRGIAVCPTNCGLLVGVDLTRKTLHWVHSQFGQTESLANRSAIRRQSHLYGSEGFLNLPMISGGLVFDLPRYSHLLQCIDLQTGLVQWQVDRENALYVAALHDDSLIVVDRQGCRALKVGTGELIWSTRLGPPGGRGVMQGDRFLVPLLNGKVVGLDARSGRQLGYPAPVQSDHGAGHLIAARDLIISTNPAELSVFRQSHSELHNLLTNRSTGIDPAERQLRIGELQLRTGDLIAAREALTTSISLAKNPSSRRSSAESLLRELLYIDLRSKPADAAATLLALDEISRTPEERINYLAHLAEFQMQQEDWSGTTATSLELTSMTRQVPLTLPGEPQLQVLSRAWGAGLLERLDSITAIRQPVRTADAAPADLPSDIADLPRRIQQFARLPEADFLREVHAGRLVAGERYQEAEALLLINRDSADPTAAAEARRRLVELWDQRGLFEEAAETLHELGTRFARTPLRDGTTGAEYYREFSKQNLTFAYARRLLPQTGSVSGVRISHSLSNTPPVRSGFTSVMRFRMNGSQQFVERNVQNRQELALVDRETGQELQTLTLEEQYFPTRPLEMNRSLIHLGGPNSAAALSVLDRKILWNDLTWLDRPVKGLLRAGPAGPDFVVYQADQTLYVADPVTGVVRWTRNDLDARDGLISDSYTGIIGDRRCLVVFKSEPGRYRIFDTLDGHEIRAGTLPLSQSYPRIAHGRMFFYSQFDPDQKLTIRVWDPLSNQHLFEDQVLPQFSQQSPLFDGGKKFAYVSADRKLKIVRTDTGEVGFQVPFPGDDNTSAINMFEDHDRYFVNIQRSVLQQVPIRRATEVRDLTLPYTPVQGELIAYSRKTAQEIWRRTFEPCSIIQIPQYRLPFFVSLSRHVAEPDRINSTGVTLCIQAIDSATGNTLGEARNHPSDYIARLSYEPDRKQLFLWGSKYTWELNFAPKLPPRQVESDGLAAAVAPLEE